MVFFMICIGILCGLWDECFYAEEKMKVYAKYAKGEAF